MGDRVVIRDWDDMAAEFGLTSLGNIKTRVYFIEDMKELCGKRGFVNRVWRWPDKTEVNIEFDDVRANEIASDYRITTDMIEFENKCDELKETDCKDGVALMSFVLGGDDEM